MNKHPRELLLSFLEKKTAVRNSVDNQQPKIMRIILIIIVVKPFGLVVWMGGLDWWFGLVSRVSPFPSGRTRASNPKIQTAPFGVFRCTRVAVETHLGVWYFDPDSWVLSFG